MLQTSTSSTQSKFRHPPRERNECSYIIPVNPCPVLVQTSKEAVAGLSSELQDVEQVLVAWSLKQADNTCP